MIRALLISSLLVMVVGCRSSDSSARIFRPWNCDDAREFRTMFQEYTNIFMVCIYEDHWEDRGPNRYSLHHFKGTVVRVYKGDWQVSEKIAFVQGLDYRAPTNAPSVAGSLGFVLTGEHTNAEIGLDTGEFHRYDTEYAPAFDCAYPMANKTVQATATAPVSSMSIRRHNTVVAVASAAASGCA
jgi:hypothetical protein